MNPVKCGLLVLITAVSASCTVRLAHADFERLAAVDYSPIVGYEAIAVLPGRPERPFVVLGRVRCQGEPGDSEGELIRALRFRAAEVGGEALINVHVVRERRGFWVATGEVIRFVRGREERHRR